MQTTRAGPANNLRGTTEWFAFVDELARQTRLPNRVMVIQEAIALLADLLGVPVVKRVPSDKCHPRLEVRLDRTRLKGSVLTRLLKHSVVK